MWQYTCCLLFYIIYTKYINLINILILSYTNQYINIYLFGIVCVLLFYFYSYKNKKIIFIFFLIFIIYFNIRNFLNVPLSNTLFLIHPLILYTCLLLILFNFLNLIYVNKYLYLFILFSIFLGGFWSLQEFNWGGWWNWDLLEVFIFTNSLLIIYSIHKFAKYTFIGYIIRLVILTINLFLMYFVLNKWGLTISIHSFIKSTFYKQYYFFYYFFIIFYIFILLQHYIYLIFYVSLYFYIINTIHSLWFLKFIFIYCIWYSLVLNFFFPSNLIKFIHKFIRFVIMLIIIINYYNIIFYNFLNLSSSMVFFYIDIYVFKLTFCSIFEINFKKLYHMFFYFKLINLWLFNLFFFLIHLTLTKNIVVFLYYKNVIIFIKYLVFYFSWKCLKVDIFYTYICVNLNIFLINSLFHFF